MTKTLSRISSLSFSLNAHFDVFYKIFLRLVKRYSTFLLLRSTGKNSSPFLGCPPRNHTHSFVKWSFDAVIYVIYKTDMLIYIGRALFNAFESLCENSYLVQNGISCFLQSIEFALEIVYSSVEFLKFCIRRH